MSEKQLKQIIMSEYGFYYRLIKLLDYQKNNKIAIFKVLETVYMCDFLEKTLVIIN